MHPAMVPRLVLVLVALLPIFTQAYGPLRWMKLPANRVVLMPSGFVEAFKGLTLPHKVTLGSPPDQSYSSMIPQFTANLDNTITLAGADLCLEVEGYQPGDSVFINHCSGEPTQKWNIVPLAHGRNQIQLMETSMCLDAVDRAGGLSQVSIELQACGDSETNVWKFEERIPLSTLSQGAATSASFRHVIISAVALAVVGSLSLSIWSWLRRPLSRAIIDRQSSSPVCVGLPLVPGGSSIYVVPSNAARSTEPHMTVVESEGFAFTTAAGAELDLDLIVMDCDGIIFDSNDFKTKAYRDALTEIDNSELADRFVNEIHLADVSVAPCIKFEQYFSEMAPRPETEIQNFVDRAFAFRCQAVERAYKEISPVSEAVALACKVPTIVVSGGDHEELQRVFGHHGIASKFAGIRGSGFGGGSKPYHLKELSEREGWDVTRTLFVGDGWTDFKTAQEFGIHFAFLREMSDWHKWEEQTANAAPGSMTICESWPDLSGRIKPRSSRR